MAKMNGCNADMPAGTVGTHSTRINPAKFGRANMSKGGINKMMLLKADKMAVKAGAAHQGEQVHMPKSSNKAR